MIYDDTKRFFENDDNGFCRTGIRGGDVLGARASTTQRKVTDKVKIAYIGIGNRGESRL